MATLQVNPAKMSESAPKQSIASAFADHFRLGLIQARNQAESSEEIEGAAAAAERDDQILVELKACGIEPRSKPYLRWAQAPSTWVELAMELDTEGLTVLAATAVSMALRCKLLEGFKAPFQAPHVSKTDVASFR